MTDKEKTNRTSIDINAGLGAVKFKVTRGDKQLYDTKLPIATAADMGSSLIRAAAQSEVIEFLLKEAEACGMRDRLDELFAKSVERRLEKEEANDR